MNSITYWKPSNTQNVIVDTIISNIIADGGTVDDYLLRDEYNDLHSTIKKQSSLVVAGGGYKTGNVYGFNPQTSGLIPFTFSRSGTATRVNKDGLIETVPANVPRMDYDPLTKRFKGLLMEKASTNLLKGSNCFDDTTWWTNLSGGAGITRTAGIANPLTGLNDFYELKRNTTSASAYMVQNFPLTAGSTYTFTVYAKIRNVGGKIGLRIVSSYPQRIDAVVDLATGAVDFSASNAWTNQAVSVTNVGNGVYRIALTGTSDITTASGNAIFGPTNQTTSSWEGTNTVLSDCLVYGAQVEESSYATSYIPTTSASVTRGQDLCNATVGSWYTAGNNCLWAKATKDHVNPTGTFPIVARLLPSAGGGFITIYDLETTINIENKNSSFANDMTGGAFVTTGTTYKVSFLANLNDGAFCVNNSSVSTDSDLAPITAGSIKLGESQGGGNIGHLAAFAYFPTRLSNTDLQAITL